MSDQDLRRALAEAWELFSELVPKPSHVEPGRAHFLPMRSGPEISAYPEDGKIEITIPFGRFVEQRDEELVARVTIEEATRLAADLHNAFWRSVRQRDKRLRGCFEALRPHVVRGPAIAIGRPGEEK